MNYHNITVDDMLNGDGRAQCSGFPAHAPLPRLPKSANRDAKSGIPFDEAAKEELFADLSRDYMDGITFSAAIRSAPPIAKPSDG